ncbi:MAG TPA: hypothetical protein VEI02_00795 [Planctomycetota bacterium]|nr:hypothetical protein [Planctomycetota bacterium]
MQKKRDGPRRLPATRFIAPGVAARLKELGQPYVDAAGNLFLEGDGISHAALTMLKLVAWNDRRHRVQRKDAADLMLLAVTYLRCGNEERLFSEFPSRTGADDFDAEDSGARLLGRYMAALLDDSGRRRIEAILAGQSDLDVADDLVTEMCREEPLRAHRLIVSLLRGLREA